MAAFLLLLLLLLLVSSPPRVAVEDDDAEVTEGDEVVDLLSKILLFLPCKLRSTEPRDTEQVDVDGDGDVGEGDDVEDAADADAAAAAAAFGPECAMGGLLREALSSGVEKDGGDDDEDADDDGADRSDTIAAAAADAADAGPACEVVIGAGAPSACLSGLSTCRDWSCGWRR